MKIPARISVAGAEYEVRVAKNVPRFNGAPCMGLTDHDRRIIWVRATMPDHLLVEVFWHEVMHCAHAQLAREVKMNDDQLNRISLGMTQVIQQVYGGNE